MQTYARYYSNFCGIDLSTDPSGVSPKRLPFAENMYRDYQGGDGTALETVPGYRRLHHFAEANSRPEKIHGIFAYAPYGKGQDYLAVHAGHELYTFPVSERDNPSACRKAILTKEGEELPLPLADQKSCAVTQNGKLYLWDGSSYLCLSYRGALSCVEEEAYIPTTYYDGKQYEQRNLLTPYFYCKYHLTEGADLLYGAIGGNDGLIYRITSEDTCEVTGCSADIADLFIPPAVLQNEKTYRVTAIAPFAFSENQTICRLRISEGITEIGYAAFKGCSALERIHLPNSLLLLGKGAFSECGNLTEAVLGAGLPAIPNFAFRATALQSVYYTGTAEEWDSLDKGSGNTPLTAATVTADYKDHAAYITFMLQEPAYELDEITLDGVPLSYDRRGPASDRDLCYWYSKENGYYIAVSVKLSDLRLYHGKVLSFRGKARSISASDGEMHGEDFFSAFPQFEGDPASLIRKCTVATVYDGRIFCGGNPDFPSLVFYTARNRNGQIDPSYFGILNYFSVGADSVPIGALLPFGSMLAIWKKDRGNDGIYLYTGKDTSSDLLPRIYIRSEALMGLGIVGDVCNFYDDNVFLSPRGLDALGRQNTAGERKILHRSSHIDPFLLKHQLSEARLCRWQGYLALLAEGSLYFGDSRSLVSRKDGEIEYDWFLLRPIGTYAEQTPRYFTATLPETAPKKYVRVGSTYLPLEGDADGTLGENEILRSAIAYESDTQGLTSTKEIVYYVLRTDEDGLRHCILCDTEGEMQGGTFFPAKELCESEGILFFGNDYGDLCCFNSDLRDEEGKLKRDAYTFDGRRYTSGFTTCLDHCDLPHYTKSTIRHSLLLKIKSIYSGGVKVKVRTDRTSFHTIAEEESGAFSFEDADFGAFTFEMEERVPLPLQEKEKRWIEKQYYIYSDEYMRPFGIYDISYRYKVAGRIKE